MSGKKGGRKAAASAAAHAASKRKTSAIEISADNESRVRDALKVTLSLLWLVGSAKRHFLCGHVMLFRSLGQTCIVMYLTFLDLLRLLSSLNSSAYCIEK